MKSQRLPKRPSSHRKESISKRKFEEFIEPWVVCSWEGPDYGIDATVEIHKLIDDTTDSHPTSKRFLVQLKSTDSISIDKKQFSYQVDVEKINYWYNSNLPVLFVVYHIPSGKLFYCWINEDSDLINHLDKKSPGWSLQKTVNIPISTNKEINESNLLSIEETVFKWKLPSKKIISPGNYFDLKSEVSDNISKLEEIASTYKFSSVSDSLNNLKDLSENAIYRIAITGPSRVGKSTLINSLLKQKISPVDMFQTTGVPINFLPGREERIHITFNNGQTLKEKLSEKNIRKFASQQENRDNSKLVKHVSVFLNNISLERGVALYDIPGLDDPNDEIRSLTWMTAKSSNAVIYMIDASPFRNHGFIFRNDFRESLSNLGDDLDKIFLVLNKIDDLHPGQLPLLKSKIEEELKRFKLYDKINKKIFYLSAKNIRKNTKDKPDNVSSLEEEIWSFLLKENKVGLIKMNNIIIETGNITNNFKSLIDARLIDNKKRREIEKIISKVKSGIPLLNNSLLGDKALISQTIHGLLQSRKNNIYDQLSLNLQNVPQEKSLPTEREIRNLLTIAINQTINNTNADYVSHIKNLKDKVDLWIQENITSVQKAISDNQANRYIDLSSIERLEFKDIEDVSGSFGMGLFTGFLGFLISPPAALVAGIGGFFLSLFMSAAERRERAINKIMNKCKNHCNETFKTIEGLYNELLNENFLTIIEYSNSYLDRYFNDLKKQLDQLDIELTTMELDKMQQSFSEIDQLSFKLKLVKERVDQTYYSLQ